MAKCQTKFCRGYTTPDGHSPYCGKCRYRRFRDKFPLKCAFNNLRKRARQRGKTFTLTFADYEKFAIESRYAAMKGKTKHSLTIHRKEHTRGYEPDNIQAVTMSLNARFRYANIPDYLLAEMEAELKRQLQCKN